MLHRRGLVAHHIYPDLVFFDSAEQTVLAPVGLICSMQTPAPYLPPEGDAPSQAGDLYKVGVFIVYIMTGAYTGVTNPAARPGCPLLEALLHPDPARRGTTATALQHAWLVVHSAELRPRENSADLGGELDELPRQRLRPEERAAPAALRPLAGEELGPLAPLPAPPPTKRSFFSFRTKKPDPNLTYC